MNVLFEEDGAFKAGTVLADNDTSLQVETTSGSAPRSRPPTCCCASPSPRPPPCWRAPKRRRKASTRNSCGRCAARRSFAFDELAREYYGHTPLPVEAAAILLRLHAAPIYFHRKGKGRFRKAPPDILTGRPVGPGEEAPAGGRHRAHGGGIAALRAARGIPARARSTAVQARPQPDRNQGPGSGVRADRPVGGPSARPLRRADLDPRLPPEPLSARVLSRRNAISANTAPPPNPPICRWPRSRQSASTTPPPPRSTTRFP